MHDLAQMAEGLGFDSFWRTDHPPITPWSATIVGQP
jgi:alkanesulfonate monooxygenase SsuD/methylene tetrahydromethanopterin reductase-like flavin-dependent oxidoreductase (luciferase family)